MMRLRRRRRLTVLREDEAGAIQVFEAVIVAVLILTSVLFFTSLQRPSQSQDSGGIDLGVLASDVLGVLSQRKFDDPGTPTDDNLTLGPAQWVPLVLQGNQTLADDVEDFLRGILGSGMQHKLLLDTGVGQIKLLPPGRDPTPLAARAAGSFVAFPLDANAAAAAGATTATYPGGPLIFSDGTVPLDCEGWTVTAPTNATYDVDGSPVGPGSLSWTTHWQDHCGSGRHDNGVDGQDDGDHVPVDVPLGVWTVNGGTCAPCYVLVDLPGRSASEALAAAGDPLRPWGLKLLLWQGA